MPIASSSPTPTTPPRTVWKSSVHLMLQCYFRLSLIIWEIIVASNLVIGLINLKFSLASLNAKSIIYWVQVFWTEEEICSFAAWVVLELIWVTGSNHLPCSTSKECIYIYQTSSEHGAFEGRLCREGCLLYYKLICWLYYYDLILVCNWENCKIYSNWEFELWWWWSWRRRCFVVDGGVISVELNFIVF